MWIFQSPAHGGNRLIDAGRRDGALAFHRHQFVRSRRQVSDAAFFDVQLDAIAVSKGISAYDADLAGVFDLAHSPELLA